MEKNNNLNEMRHSLAHLLGASVLELYPNTKLTLGPATDTGFYYDFDFEDTKISDEDLEKIEKKMKSLIKDWNTFEKIETDKDEVLKTFEKNIYKTELINEITEKNEEITLYKSGNFVDLCRGGHIENMQNIDIDSFVLEKVAGAYWRGNEKNKMLTRIYGLAFNTKEKLEAHLKQQEEAKKRDHRKLGKELELFTIIDEIGPGLPLFYPKGAILRRNIEEFVTKVQEKKGFKPIWIPHITKGELYKISGHLDKYDAMYSPMEVDNDNYYLKPMNCPHFMMLYKSLPHSYKELPVRYVSTTTNYRYEKSGELSGLTRVRALTQDDCHVFAEPEKIEEEIKIMLEMIEEIYQAFGLNDFYVRISLRDPNKKENYLGNDKVWDIAENALRNIVSKTNWVYKEEEGEAAFYGPKLDFMFKDAIGREWQLSTIQLDFNLPEKFELEYTNKEGKKERPVVIHRAILGSTERFLGIMIEHFAGAFPLWLSPIQIMIVPVRNEQHGEYANNILNLLLENNIRAEINSSDDSLGKRINSAKAQKIPYVIVIGDKEMESGKLTIETRGEKIENITIESFIEKLQKEISEKTLN